MKEFLLITIGILFLGMFGAFVALHTPLGY